MKKKTTLIITLPILIIISIFLINNCSKKQSDQIKIGAIFPLTGRFAAMGEPLKFATDIAVSGVNGKGGINGKKLVVEYGDSKGEPKEAVTLAQKFITVENIPILTTFLTSVSLAVKPIAENNDVFLLAQTVSPQIYKDTKMTVRFHFSFVEEGKILGKYLVSQNPQKVGLIHSNDPSTSFQADSVIIPLLDHNNIQHVQEKFNVGNKEFSAIVKKIVSAKCDNIYIGAYGSDMPPILAEFNKYKTNKNKIKICGNIGFIELPVNTPKDLYEEVVFTTPKFMIDQKGSKLIKFIEDYKKISGYEQIGYAAFYAYDMIMILADVLIKTDSTSPKVIRENFTGNFTGFGGDYYITPEGDVSPKVVLGKFENGLMVKY